ncbi:MAG: hypothetical protein UT17_C0003G0118 [Candidatus Woesebacteria bacterium GW2011_GWB1_39_10]|uniref:Uncharacterized protein n=2 Tax=Candidatus Woeseibacteriota TaxID=1752722 RepID=A0A0G0LVT2_9BACT|nr:MAG: hypothetical protein UT17_C0003G0118 [Candidatus Woesebacteria bacterium GW2011_GWB1_39_10]KKS91055.1 MAG: hypothetical protein UV66_C0001G0412 [Candidatus Woesebacteria bacterium GW2011_GWA1_43_12]
MDKLDSVIPQHETLINKPDKDLIYARKYWEKPDRGYEDFANMMNGVVVGAKNGMLSLVANPATEDGKELISAYRRLGNAIGIDLKQFSFNPKTEISHALVYEGDDSIPEVVHAEKDRDYAIRLLIEDKDRDAFFKAMKSSLKETLSRGDNIFVQLIGGDKPGELSEDSKARLSARRVLYKAFGYNVGQWDVRLKSGTAILNIER